MVHGQLGSFSAMQLAANKQSEAHLSSRLAACIEGEQVHRGDVNDILLCYQCQVVLKCCMRRNDQLALRSADSALSLLRKTSCRSMAAK